MSLDDIKYVEDLHNKLFKGHTMRSMEMSEPREPREPTMEKIKAFLLEKWQCGSKVSDFEYTTYGVSEVIELICTYTCAERDALKGDKDGLYTANVRLVKAYDAIVGTPCEQIRHAEVVADLTRQLAEAQEEARYQCEYAKDIEAECARHLTAERDKLAIKDKIISGCIADECELERSFEELGVTFTDAHGGLHAPEVIEKFISNLKGRLAESGRAREALKKLMDHIDLITYRDGCQLRLGEGTPQYDAAKQALKEPS